MQRLERCEEHPENGVHCLVSTRIIALLGIGSAENTCLIEVALFPRGGCNQ